MAPSYDNLDALIGTLKQAAIDAYMKSEGWQLRDGRYEINSRGPDFYVSRPGADGEGGGDWEASEWLGNPFGLVDRDEEFRTAFDQVRTRVDNAIERWLRLPDPEQIGTLVEHARQANRLLSLAAATNGGQATGGGSIEANLVGIQENSDEMAGETIGAFKSKFLLRLRSAISGHHAITVVLGGALAAQENVWREARQTVADTVQQSTSALSAYANDNDVDWEVALKVAGWAGKGVQAFLTGGASGVLDGAGVGIDILKESADPKNADKPEGNDYEGLMSAYETALNQNDKAITAEEKALQDNIDTNLSNIEKDKGSYDLSRPALLDISDDSQLSADTVIISRALVNEITEIYMPAIAAELGNASEEVWSAYDSDATNRDPSIGYSAFGISDFHLIYLLYKLLADLTWEVENGAETLQLVIEDIGREDEETKDALEQHAEKVKDGSGWTPFPS